MKYRKSELQIQKIRHIEWLKDPNNRNKIPDRIKIPVDRLAKLEADITGKIVFPWSPGYDKDKQEFNNVYPANPAAIIYAANYSDIQEVLSAANEFNIWTVIRSGGHSLADYSVCDGFVIDMSELNDVFVDLANLKVTVGAGCTFERLFPILEFYGLHVPGGGCPSVCVAGYMMGGGFGITSRAFGMNCDNVDSVTVMLYDGSIVVANAQQNQDLYWAIRGGTGGNFGVLLNITYNLVQLGDIYGTKIKYVITEDPVDAAQALKTMQDQYLLPSQYPNLGIETVLCTDTDGLKKVMFCCSWIGTETNFLNAITPMLELSGAEKGKIIKGKYSKVNAAVLEGTPNLPEGIKAYSRSTIIEKSLSFDDWMNILKYYNTCPNKYTMVDMECYGGKINEVSQDFNAFIHRNGTMDFFCDAFFNKETNDQKKNEIWLEDFFVFMSQYGNGHSYQNYPNRLQEDYRYAYWGNYYHQLYLIKTKYDPNNFFHYQQSIGAGNPLIEDNKQLIFEKSSPIIYEKY